MGVLGVLAALCGLELTLRAASAVLRPLRPAIEGAGPDNAIRILCIGESTTAGLWPDLLEARLNQQHPDLRVPTSSTQARSVSGPATSAPACPQWLDQARPQIVITMLGINDEGNVLVYPRSDPRAQLVERSKALELLALLWRSVRGSRRSTRHVADGARA